MKGSHGKIISQEAFNDGQKQMALKALFQNTLMTFTTDV